MKDIEKDILQMLADGTRVQVIADVLGCSTTEIHRAKVKYPDFLKQLQGRNLDGVPIPEQKPEAPPEEAPRKHSIAELFQQIERLQSENSALKEDAFSNALLDEPEEIPAGYKRNPEFYEKRDRRVMVLMQPSLHDRIKLVARSKSLSVNDVIHGILSKALKGYEL